MDILILVVVSPRTLIVIVLKRKGFINFAGVPAPAQATAVAIEFYWILGGIGKGVTFTPPTAAVVAIVYDFNLYNGFETGGTLLSQATTTTTSNTSTSNTWYYWELTPLGDTPRRWYNLALFFFFSLTKKKGYW